MGSLNQKDPQRGPGVERGVHANAITMVGVGMGDAWRKHEFPQHHYATFILMCQVNYFGNRSICELILLIRMGSPAARVTGISNARVTSLPRWLRRAGSLISRCGRRLGSLRGAAGQRPGGRSGLSMDSVGIRCLGRSRGRSRGIADCWHWSLKVFADVRSNSLQAGGPAGGRGVLRATITQL